jgi:hypothetical protein
MEVCLVVIGAASEVSVLMEPSWLRKLILYYSSTNTLTAWFVCPEALGFMCSDCPLQLCVYEHIHHMIRTLAWVEDLFYGCFNVTRSMLFVRLEGGFILCSDGPLLLCA